MTELYLFCWVINNNKCLQKRLTGNLYGNTSDYYQDQEKKKDGEKKALKPDVWQ